MKLGAVVVVATLVVAAPRSSAQDAGPARTSAQDSKPTDGLRAAVEAYFAVREDDAAETALAEILARPDADAPALYAAVTAPPPAAPARTVEPLPYAGDLLQVSYFSGRPRAPGDPRLPVVLDVSYGSITGNFPESGEYLVAHVNGYTPPEFSDVGRNGFLKLLRHAAWRLGGDPDRLWMTGFSWAAHASCDTAAHRPHWLRGIAAVGGGPRRKHFRLFPNLAGLEYRMWCGAKDDEELVWNVKETKLLAPKHGFAATLALDPDVGHTFPLKGFDDLPTTFRDVPARTTEQLLKALALPLYADGPGVESPLLRIDAVDEKRVAVPDRVPVDASASYDEKRRRTLKAYEKSVVKAQAKLALGPLEKNGPPATSIALELDGVRAATVFLRAPFAESGRRVVVKARGKVLHDAPLEIDRATLLREVRRTGERLRPALRAVTVGPP